MEDAASQGRTATYGEFFLETHRHADGTVVSDAAEEEIVRFLFLIF